MIENRCVECSLAAVATWLSFYWTLQRLNVENNQKHTLFQRHIQLQMQNTWTDSGMGTKERRNATTFLRYQILLNHDAPYFWMQCLLLTLTGCVCVCVCATHLTPKFPDCAPSDKFKWSQNTAFKTKSAQKRIDICVSKVRMKTK